MSLQRIIDGSDLDLEPSFEGTECWIWKRGKDSQGYGVIYVDGAQWTVHRYAYTVTFGQIPDGLLVRHMCHRKSCCNPKHLRLGTYRDNWQDSEEIHREAARTRIHPDSEECVIDGVLYSSLRKATESTGLERRTILNFLSDGVFDRQRYQNSTSKKPWIVDDRPYNSRNEAAKATGINYKYISLYSRDRVFDRQEYESRLSGKGILKRNILST